MSRYSSREHRICAFLVNNDAHGQDHAWAGCAGNFICLVVADGVTSSEDSGALSKEIVQRVRNTFEQVYSHKEFSSFELFLSTLHHDFQGIDASLFPHARSTLSVAILNRNVLDLCGEQVSSVNYYCLGDSPILVCRRQALSPEFPDSFVCFAVHDQPLVSDSGANIYSWFDGSTGMPSAGGRAGSFYLGAEEICLVMTDGVPMFPAIAKDTENNFKFLNTVFSRGARAGVNILKRIYKKIVLTDDASIAVACLRHSASKEERTDDRQT